MTSILRVSSSSNLESSMTRKIGATLVADFKKSNSDAVVIERDLIKSSIPHLSPEYLGAMMTGDESVLKLSTELVNELTSSDVIVLEAPMYNFAIPSVLKAWIDHVCRAGKTFEYSEEGPKGLLQGKKAIIVLGRGGVYSEGPAQVMDHQEPYLRAVLGFIGITDVESIYIEGGAMGPEAAAEALAKAEQRSHELLG